MIHTKGLLTMTSPNNKVRYMCFQDKNVADSCKNFMITYKNNHGEWPHINMSQDSIKIHKGKQPKNTPNEYETLSIIDEMLEDVLITASLSGAEYLLCNQFSYIPNYNNDFTISFSGQEIDSVIDENDFKKFLNSYDL